MIRSSRSEQEDFWAGEFGSAYIGRNNEAQIIASNVALFSTALTNCSSPSSILEFGANIGLNLRALRCLFPSAEIRGVEINPHAATILRDVIGSNCVFEGSILDFESDVKFELVLVKGVLIHVNPEQLPLVYEKIYDSSSKFIFICEYFNPSPVSVPYRGHVDRLFKRDFAGELLDRFEDVELVDYGFVYKRDASFPLDDVTWFLLRK